MKIFLINLFIFKNNFGNNPAEENFLAQIEQRCPDNKGRLSSDARL